MPRAASSVGVGRRVKRETAVAAYNDLIGLRSYDAHLSVTFPTSFPGSLFSASLGRWKKDPGCGWSRAKLWHKLFHRGRVNQQFLSVSTEAKERSFEIFQSCCKLHTGQMKYI